MNSGCDDALFRYINEIEIGCHLIKKPIHLELLFNFARANRVLKTEFYGSNEWYS